MQATTSVKHFYSHAKFGDHNYENKEDCDWVIEAPAGKNVHLTFLTFELEDEHECGYDSVEVYQGFDDSGPSNGRFCGNRVSNCLQLDNAISRFYLEAKNLIIAGATRDCFEQRSFAGSFQK